MSKLLDGAEHSLPSDVATSLRDADKTEVWNSLTPLGRNEFICWITSAKKAETRQRRITIAIDKLQKGERRPCCWAGCTHRVKTGHA